MAKVWYNGASRIFHPVAGEIRPGWNEIAGGAASVLLHAGLVSLESPLIEKVLEEKSKKENTENETVKLTSKIKMEAGKVKGSEK